MKISDLIFPIEEETQTINFNGNDIVVKQYLPIEEKLQLITNVINNARDGYNFSNPVKLEIYAFIEIFKYYTDIEFEEDDINKDLGHTYDSLEVSGLIEEIYSCIPEEELQFILDSIENFADKYYTYLNSALGIMDNIVNSYGEAAVNAEEVNSKIANPENLKLVKEILTKLG